MVLGGSPNLDCICVQLSARPVSSEGQGLLVCDVRREAGPRVQSGREKRSPFRTEITDVSGFKLKGEGCPPQPL